MKPEEYLLVEARIRRERENLSRVLGELEKHGLYPEVRSTQIGGFHLSDDEALRILGSILSDFYTFFENMAKSVASRLDRSMPSGDEWHKELLTQMTLAIPGLRPSLISAATARLMEPYRGFRHVFRNLYGFQLNPGRVLDLVRGLPESVAALDRDLERFMREMRTALEREDAQDQT